MCVKENFNLAAQLYDVHSENVEDFDACKENGSKKDGGSNLGSSLLLLVSNRCGVPPKNSFTLEETKILMAQEL